MIAAPEMATPEWMGYARAAIALLFVTGLIFLCGAVARKAGLARRLGAVRGSGRLRVIESLYLDPRHRLVLIAAGEREHLLLIGAAGSRLIESRDAAHPKAAHV